MNNLLNGFTVIDFTHRLPGPHAGQTLVDLGARVIKIEDKTFGDAFSKGLFAQMDTSFKAWYEELNRGKEILEFDFKDEGDHEKIRNLIKEADALIMGPPMKVRQKLKITNDELKELNPQIVAVELLASKENKKAMHDLNALADTGLLSLYIARKKSERLEPPFLPVAGIAFGTRVATDLLAALLKSKKTGEAIFTNTYLYESTLSTFNAFWPKSEREKGNTLFLHNGIYPCYNMYKTKDDHYIALAAVEEKFWLRFCELFNLEIAPEERFHHQTDKIYQKIQDVISAKTLDEIDKMTHCEEICLSLVPRIGAN